MATWRVMPPLPGLDIGSAGDPVPMAGTMGHNISPRGRCYAKWFSELLLPVDVLGFRASK